MYQPKSDAEALDIYRKLTLIRQCQEAIIREYPTDDIKTPVHLGIGLEGVSVGVTHLLPKNTKVLDYYRNHGTYLSMVPAHKQFGQLRNHGQYLAITGETDDYFAELYGRTTGTGGGKSGSMHLASPEHGLVATSGIVASTIPLAVGAAFAAKYRGEDTVAVAMFGDGAVEEGDFWESLNLACLHKLRVLFVYEDNGLAAQTPADQRRGYRDIIAAVSGFNAGIHASRVDGTDVLKVLGAVKELLMLMGASSRPAFLSAKWFRFNEHVGPNTDWDKGYRALPSREEQDAADPVRNYERWLLASGYTTQQMKRIYSDVHEQIEASIAKAQAAPHPGAEELYQGVFA